MARRKFGWHSGTLTARDVNVENDLTVTGDFTVNGDFTFGDAATDNLIIAGDLRINDNRNLHFGTDEDGSITYDETTDNRVEVTGADWHWTANQTIIGTLTVGVDDTGYDVQFFGATSGAHLLWDESADTLKLVGGAALNAQGTVTVGVDDTGYDVQFFGATSGSSLLWDESADSLILEQGVGIFEKDNGTSLRVKGASEATSASAGADIQNYAGIFTNAGYNDGTALGTKKNRTTFSANLDSDLAFVTPHQLRLVAADNSVTGGDADTATTNGIGNIMMISRSDVHISPWANAESPEDNRLVITGTTATVDTPGDVVVKANTGNLRLNFDVTDGAVVMPSLTTTERDALSGVNGMVVYNETTNKLNVYENGAWVAFTTV